MSVVGMSTENVDGWDEKFCANATSFIEYSVVREDLLGKL